MITANSGPQTSFSRYGQDQLPDGFAYPPRYIALSNGHGLPLDFDWWFTDAASVAGQRAWTLRQEWKSEGYGGLQEIDPIPFARNGDLAAYFDGSTPNGTTPVFIVDLGNKAFDRRYPDFDAWLAEAQREGGR